MVAICLVIYSTVTGSSTVNRWLWHSIRALSIRTRPSAVRPNKLVRLRQCFITVEELLPAKARQMWSSSIATLRTVRGSCNCSTDFFSTPRTTTSLPRTPTYPQVEQSQVHRGIAHTAHVPRLTASDAYSTYARCVNATLVV